jgi:hypothetical protein
MKPLIIEATDETPRVILDAEKGIFEFSGNSYPENSVKFFTPIIEWLKEFTETLSNKNISVEFNFDYFNTSSAKFILEILRIVQGHYDKGNECIVRWYYQEDDTDMYEQGEDYQSTTTVPFQIIERIDA